MHSERVIEQDIKTLEELKRPPTPPKPQLRRTKNDLAPNWEDVDVGGPAERAKRRLGERLADRPGALLRPAGRRAGFDENDLKELRKAIKAKDNTRIAELTAKINRPSSEDPR